MKRLVFAVSVFAVAIVGYVMAQSAPPFTQGLIPTIAQWQSYFSGKVDVTNGTLTNPTITGATFAGFTAVSADPTGVTDSTSAINSAAATGKNVYIPKGTYRVNGQINLSANQCLYGDGDHVTFLSVDQSFSSSANGVISLTGNGDFSACVHDIAVSFIQPADIVTTTTALSAVGANTITVTSTTGISVNNYVTDKTATAAIPSQTTVTAIAGNILTLSANIVSPGVGSGDSINFGPSRSNFTTLALGCTSGAGGTGCEYPPAIYDTTSNRARFWNILIQDAWDCINTTGNIVPWITNIECGALHIGWQADGAQDSVHVKGWHEWGFGMSATGPSGVQRDGQVIAWQLGRIDGLHATDIFFLDSRLVTTTNANNSIASWAIDNFALDGNNSNIEINGGPDLIVLSVGYKTGTTTTSTCPINITGGSLQIANLLLDVGGSSNIACVSGGYLKVTNANLISANGAISLFSQTAGKLDVENNYFTPPATITAPMIVSTGGSTIVARNIAHPGTSGTAVSISTDGALNVVAGNNFQQYGYSLPTGATSGFYSIGSLPSVSPLSDPQSLGAGAQTMTQFPSTTGTYRDTAFGYNALAGAMTTAATSDTAFGSNACSSITSGTNNTCVGVNTETTLTTGAGNTAIGQSALKGAVSANNNTIVGANAGIVLTGNANTAVGQNSMVLGTTAANNVAVGISAGNKLTSGASNLILGSFVGNGTLATGSNNILLGTSGSVDTVASSTSNELNIGGMIFQNLTSTAAPAVSGGTSPVIDSHANNRSGTVTFGTGTVTSGTITFAGTGYSSWNHCRVTSQSALTSFAYSYSLTVITLTASSLTSAKVDYDCDGY